MEKQTQEENKSLPIDEKSREDFCLWYYAQPQPLSAHIIFDHFKRYYRNLPNEPSIQEDGLNKVYEQYIELLILELHETVPLASRLGWESTKFAKGEKLRHKINQLKLKS